jgi:hypothetical protein
MSVEKSGANLTAPSTDKHPVSPLALTPRSSPQPESQLPVLPPLQPPPAALTPGGPQAPRSGGAPPRSPLSLLGGRGSEGEGGAGGSIMDSLSGEINVYAQSASNTLSELFSESINYFIVEGNETDYIEQGPIPQKFPKFLRKLKLKTHF